MDSYGEASLTALRERPAAGAAPILHVVQLFVDESHADAFTKMAQSMVKVLATL